MNAEAQNPFQMPAAPPEPKARAAADSGSWGIVASGPPIDPSEVETLTAAVEVTVLWGDDDVLHVAHVSPPRDVFVGEAEGCEYALGAEVLGARRLPVVLERGGQLSCVLPEGATGEVSVGGAMKTFDELAAEGRLTTSQDVPGARLYSLPDDSTAWVRHRGLTFMVRPTQAGREIAKTSSVDVRRYAWIGLSLAVHAVLLLGFYFLPPSSHALSLDQVMSNDRMIAYLDPGDAADVPEPVEWEESVSEAPGGGDGTRAADDEGQAGDETAPETGGRYAVEGREDNPDPQLARNNIRENMQTVGAIGAVRALLGSFNAPTSPYGAEMANGRDPSSHIGALMGAQAGNSFGYGGLGMQGTGRGAGGFGLGTMGLGTLGTLGHGSGGDPNGQGYGPGYGGSVGLRDREPNHTGPRLRPGTPTVNGSLSREVIRRVVRRHLAEVRFCYEQGLQQNPSIEGRVVVNWIISPTGAVAGSSVASSTLGSDRVESCVAGAVRRWSFPAPDGGGPVGVNYPFVLQAN